MRRTGFTCRQFLPDSLFCICGVSYDSTLTDFSPNRIFVRRKQNYRLCNVCIFRNYREGIARCWYLSWPGVTSGASISVNFFSLNLQLEFFQVFNQSFWKLRWLYIWKHFWADEGLEFPFKKVMLHAGNLSGNQLDQQNQWHLNSFSRRWWPLCL